MRKTCTDRKILRKIFGQIREQDGTFRTRMNFETWIDNENIVSFMKSQGKKVVFS